VRFLFLVEIGNFIGDNPTYETSEESRRVGDNIRLFYENGVGSTALQASFSNFQSCENQAIACCFGADRQSNDNNGNCSDDDCADADPADNSNLCFTEPSFTAYPQASEGSVHCHGLAWSDDSNDFSARFKYNNFFYVSMYGELQLLKCYSYAFSFAPTLTLFHF